MHRINNLFVVEDEPIQENKLCWRDVMVQWYVELLFAAALAMISAFRSLSLGKPASQRIGDSCWLQIDMPRI